MTIAGASRDYKGEMCQIISGEQWRIPQRGLRAVADTIPLNKKLLSPPPPPHAPSLGLKAQGNWGEGCKRTSDICLKGSPPGLPLWIRHRCGQCSV